MWLTFSVMRPEHDNSILVDIVANIHRLMVGEDLEPMLP